MAVVIFLTSKPAVGIESFCCIINAYTATKKLNIVEFLLLLAKNKCVIYLTSCHKQ